MGTVYRARQISLDRQVAIKLLAAAYGKDQAFRERFRREGLIQARIDHPHIVAVYEAGESEHGLFLAMRAIQGPTLKTLIARRELEGARTLRLLEPIADALDTAHEAGLVHRDIKPQNILIGPRDHAYLSDFGLTKGMGEVGGLTRTGQFVGTLDYVAPEQIRGETPSASTDVYALAAVLYECLTGQVPFAKPSDAAVLYAHMSDAPPKVTDKRPELPTALDDVIERGMAKAPDDRYVSAGALIDAVREALGSQARAVITPPDPIDAPEEAGVRPTEARVPTRETRVRDAPEPPPPAETVVEREPVAPTAAGTTPAADATVIGADAQSSGAHAIPDLPAPPVETAEANVIRPDAAAGDATVLRDDAPAESGGDATVLRDGEVAPAAEPEADATVVGGDVAPESATRPISRQRSAPSHSEQRTTRSPAPEPVRTPPAPAPTRVAERQAEPAVGTGGRDVSTGLVLGGAAVLAAIGIAGGLALGGGGDSDTTTTAARTTAVDTGGRSADAGGVSIRIPDGWERGDTGELRGIRVRDAIELTPAAATTNAGKEAGIVVGRVAGTDPRTLLPASYAKDAELPGGKLPDPVHVEAGGTQSLRYDLPAAGGDLRLYATPTTGGTVVVACRVAQAARRACDETAASRKLSGASALPVSPSKAFADAAGAALGDYWPARAQQRDALAAAKTPRGQARSARRLAQLSRRTALAIPTKDLPVFERNLASSLVKRLRSAGDGYARMASGAVGNNRGTYVQGRDAVRSADTAIAKVVDRLAAAGYDLK